MPSSTKSTNIRRGKSSQSDLAFSYRQHISQLSDTSCQELPSHFQKMMTKFLQTLIQFEIAGVDVS